MCYLHLSSIMAEAGRRGGRKERKDWWRRVKKQKKKNIKQNSEGYGKKRDMGQGDWLEMRKMKGSRWESKTCIASALWGKDEGGCRIWWPFSGKYIKSEGQNWASEHNFSNINRTMKTLGKEIRHPDPSVFACYSCSRPVIFSRKKPCFGCCCFWVGKMAHLKETGIHICLNCQKEAMYYILCNRIY